MELLAGVLIFSQLAFTIVAGLFFYNSLKVQQNSKNILNIDSKTEMEKIRRMRNIALNKPLSEKTRPTDFLEIIGQSSGIKALRAAMCGANPQHVIIYGYPGVGKTAAARLMLEVAKKSINTPFAQNAPFIEVDATIMQFDERSIADPLIGSVHDPIYQGAGAYGQAGIPQLKPGAVTNAHGGVLFLDEIGELSNVQMNKLLKVLEDGKVIFTSSYYSKENKNIPTHIHDVFTNGMPADFRLIGATTRRPEDLPPALRSRCTEVFFRGLTPIEIMEIAEIACNKAKISFVNEVPKLISEYSSNGRDAVTIVQTAASIASLDGRSHILLEDVEEVLEHGHYAPNRVNKVGNKRKIGVANGLGVGGMGTGMVLEIEAEVAKAKVSGKGFFKITGIVEEEEINNRAGKVKRKSCAKSSVENVMTLISKICQVDSSDYDIHLNFPGGVPVDGPSAGTAIFTAIYSALIEKPIDPKIAITGEISIKGRVCPVGGVSDKIEAAIEAGAEKILIPRENYQKIFKKYLAEIIVLDDIHQLIAEVFKEENEEKMPENQKTLKSEKVTLEMGTGVQWKVLSCKNSKAVQLHNES